MKQTSEKKCPSCGDWTPWNREKEDVCLHCGAALSDFEQKKQAREEKMRAAPTGLFPVNPTDGVFIKAGKYTINTLNFVFTAIVSFIVWLITFVAA